MIQNFRKAGLLASSAVALVVTASADAQAACNIGDPVGPGGEQVISFLAATSNAITSAVTAMNTAFQTQTGAFITSPTSTAPDQFTGGVWGRAIGGRADIDSADSGTRTRPGNIITPLSCQTRTRNDFVGAQGGIDSGRLNIGSSGWNAHVGLTAGYFETESRSSSGSGLTRAEVPFVGAYAALLRGGFFIDAQVVAQFYNINVNEQQLGVRGGMDAKGFGITSSAGYHWVVGDYFIEPSAGVVYSRSNIDPLNITAAAWGQSGLRSLAVNMNLNDVETLLGRVGVRVGTSFQAGSVTLQPFASASVWHEFADNTQMSAVFDPLATNNRATMALASNRIGTFGQYSIGMSVAMPDTGWFGYARLDYRNGENIESLSVNGGIRYQFAPAPQGAAAAADAAEPRMVTKAPAKPAAVVQERWSGFYLGGYVGGAWSGNVTATELAADPIAGGVVAYNGIGTQTRYGLGSSFIGGLTVGYNRQMGSFVAGVEAEGGYLRLAGSAPFGIIDPEKVVVSATKIGDWYALLAGRLGVTVGPALIYAKGGGALLSITSSDIDATTPLVGLNHNTVDAAGGNPLGLAWVGGGGIEYAVNSNWSIKGEYLYFATHESHVASGPGFGKAGLPVGADHTQYFNWRHDVPGVHTAKFGVNYKFGS